jgi:hypothetical protein
MPDLPQREAFDVSKVLKSATSSAKHGHRPMRTID